MTQFVGTMLLDTVGSRGSTWIITNHKPSMIMLKEGGSYLKDPNGVIIAIELFILV